MLFRSSNMNKCECGRSLTKPFCDRSCTLTEESYQKRLRDWAAEDEALYGKPIGDLFKDDPTINDLINQIKGEDNDNQSN